MSRQTRDEKLLDIAAAAHLYAEGMPRGRIGATLESNATMGGRLVEAAKKPIGPRGEPYLKVEFNADLFDDARLAAIMQRASRVNFGALELALKRIAPKGVPLRRLDVIHSGSIDRDSEGYDRRLRAVGRIAARRVRAHLADGTIATCGIAWGSMMAALVDGLRALCQVPPGRDRPAHFVACCGDPLTGPTPVRLSASHLAAMLDEVINGGVGRWTGLGAVPASIPMKFASGEKMAVIEEFLTEATSYGEVFGGATPLAERLDLILTSMGLVGDPRVQDAWLQSRLLGELKSRPRGSRMTPGDDVSRVAEDLSRFVAGDLGGIFFPKTNQAEDLRVVARLNARWKGIKEDHVKACAVRAAGREFGGVVAVVAGCDKEQLLLDILSDGYINELIIDHDLAEKLAARTLASGAGPGPKPLRRPGGRNQKG